MDINKGKKWILKAMSQLIEKKRMLMLRQRTVIKSINNQTVKKQRKQQKIFRMI